MAIIMIIIVSAMGMIRKKHDYVYGKGEYKDTWLYWLLYEHIYAYTTISTYT